MNPQTPARLTGSASMSFQNPVYVVSCASVVGKKEGEGPLGSKFDLVCEEPMFGEATWEAAESTMQKEAAALALGKAGDIRMTFAGDLLAQTTASSFGIAGMGIPFYGLFGACSTIGESLSLGAMSVAAGYGEHILCATSSHFASAEKQFRFPLGNSYLVQVLDIKYKASNFKGFIQINFFYYSMPKFLFSFLI